MLTVRETLLEASLLPPLKTLSNPSCYSPSVDWDKFQVHIPWRTQLKKPYNNGSMNRFRLLPETSPRESYSHFYW